MRRECGVHPDLPRPVNALKHVDDAVDERPGILDAAVLNLPGMAQKGPAKPRRPEEPRQYAIPQADIDFRSRQPALAMT
jgi:hypothetical protein